MTAMIYLFSTWIVVFLLIDLIQRFLLGNIIDEGMFILFMLILFFWNARLHLAKSKLGIIMIYTITQILVLLFIVILILAVIYVITPESMNVNREISIP
jgi:hypothetical protein